MTTATDSVKLTVGQAIVRFLAAQYVERDGVEHKFFDSGWGIFGHGNVAGLGQGILEENLFRYYLPRNEQSMVLAAIGFAKAKNRLQAMFCTSSIGPGATNMVTAAAVATVNRIPVLLLPGDIFARRNVAPVLQQVESAHSQDVSVNDCFRPVSRYWDRIQRPEQILTALPEALRVLTSPTETGAVTLALPQDVQAESYEYPRHFFNKRVWTIARPRPDAALVKQAADLIRASDKPLIVAGGGVIYSDACDELARFVEATGVPAGETQAGKGSLRFDNPRCLGALGHTGAKGAIEIAAEADVIIGVGTRYNDFVTQSKSGFANPNARFVNINLDAFDAGKHNSLSLVGDAKATLQELRAALKGYATDSDYQARVQRLNAEWDAEVTRVYGLEHGPQVSQGEVIGAVNAAAGERGILVCAAGSLPGDLHKLWRTAMPQQYHMEYGYSCMGYEIAGGLGVKMALPDREVFVMVGDGSYLMLAQEIATSIQEGYKLNIVLINNHGFASIGALSRAVGCESFGTQYRYRDEQTGRLDGDLLPVDYVKNAQSLGAEAVLAKNMSDVRQALAQSVANSKTTVVVVETDPLEFVPGYGWWDVPVAATSKMPAVNAARAEYVETLKRERVF